MHFISWVRAAALERLDVVAAPRFSGSNPLSALAAALRITQAALEASQAATFGAEVCCHF